LGNGDWDWKVTNVRRVPYRLPELIAADPAEPVFVPEGEKDVERLRALGLVATCNAGGAGKWRAEYTEHFAGKTVIILPDNDDAGRKHAQQVHDQLSGITAKVAIVELPALPEKGDVSDWLAAGGTRDQLLALVEHSSQASIGDIGDKTLKPNFEAIVPLVESLPEFPIDALPLVLSRFASELSVATQTPLDMAALLSLAACATAIAKRVEAQITSDWSEPANIYVMVGLDSGNRKSSVFKKAMAPLNDWERSERERLAPEIRAYEQAYRILAGRVKKLEDKAGREADPHKRRLAEEGAAQALAELAALTPVYAPRLIADDATPESITTIMLQQGGRLACMSPEGGMFEMMRGKYSKMPNFDIFLKGHAGDDHRVDRVSRPSEFIPKAALTLALCVQTAVIQEVSANRDFASRGLTARFLYALPESPMGRRRIDAQPMSADVEEAYSYVVRELCSMEVDLDEGGMARAWRVPLSSEAHERLRKYRCWLEPQLGEGKALYDIQSWASKLPGAIVRLATIMHAAEYYNHSRWWEFPITEETMAQAITVGEYLLPHAQAALSMMLTTTELAGARRILAWILSHDKRQVTHRDVWQATKNRFKKSADLDEPLALLVDHNYVRLLRLDRSGPGRPGGPTYEANPELFISGFRKVSPISPKSEASDGA
jgi:hypothetical protein